MIKKTAVAAALAALAVPAAAAADKTGEPHNHGKSSTPKSQKVGLTLKGVTSSLDLNEARNALAAPLVIDPTSANRAARLAFVELTTPKQVRTGNDTVTLADAVAGLNVTFVGLEPTETLDPTQDTVKVIGKITRTRSGKGKPNFTYDVNTIDIKKIVVTRKAS